MTERPILFSAPMVQALLAGKKTQTRRAVRLAEGELVGSLDRYRIATHGSRSRTIDCPYGVAGGRLWVRENGWERPERTPKMMREGADTWARYYYDADGENADELRHWGFKRRPSIHMPRWACRLVLDITGIRAERLHAITEADAEAEGADKMKDRTPTARDAYRYIWEAINGRESWAANPWVWVVEFKRANPETSGRKL